jgi:hypothetical protein
MTHTRRPVAVFCLLALLVVPVLGAQRKLKPGFNLFSKDQDVQLGKEAAAQVEKQYEVVTDPVLDGYLKRIGSKLAAQPEADKYPYTFKLVKDPTLNAFALPGGPTFVHTGLITAAENEAQLAGVMAHEISHVALRHGTNQASKANLIQLPALLAGAAVGGSMIGQLAQLGIGLGANSVLLKFSRSAERDADLLGARIMAGAGYNPIEMARFFEKLEADGGSRGPQFFASHPNPGNRVKAVEEEIRYLPQRDYTTGSGDFQKVKALVAKLPPPVKKPGQAAAPAATPDVQASSQLKEFQGREFTISHPDNWRSAEGSEAGSAIIAPEGGAFQDANGGVQVGLGVMTGIFTPKSARNLQEATSEFVEQVRSGNPQLQVGQGRAEQLRVDGSEAIRTTLSGPSPYQGEREIDNLVTIARPNGRILYFVFVSPESRNNKAQPVFKQMLRSVRLPK